MKPEPEPLNIPLPTSSFTWQKQRFLILVSAFLSLYVILPTSLALAVCALLVGTPLFWLIFGSGIVPRYTFGILIFRVVVFAALAYLAVKLIIFVVPLLAHLLVGYVTA